MHRVTFIAVILASLVVVAGCRYLLPEDGSDGAAPPTLPAPSQGAPRLSPSIEIPPPIY